MGITPDLAARLAREGHEVVVEREAGLAAGFDDRSYQEAGARTGTAKEAWSVDLALIVEDPDPSPGPAALLGLLHPFDRPEAMVRLARTGVTAFAFEAVPRTTRAQTVDALSSQATVSGYRATLEAAAALDRFFPMLTTAAGTIRPAKVLVLGAGVAGLQAIATARRLGAVVSAFDVRAAAAEQVQSLGATFIETGISQDEAQTGGYAQEVSADEELKIVEVLAPHIEAADAVIATASVPGRPAPRLVSAESVERMRRGAVIVDLAASSGGNCELTRPGSTIEHGGVRIIGDTDLASRVAGHASSMYARNAAAFVELVVDEDGKLAPDWEDDIVAAMCVTRDGKVVHPGVRERLGDR